MQKGYVFAVADGFFGIFTFSTPIIMRVIPDATTEQEACAALSAQFAGHFTPANNAVKRYARGKLSRRGASILTD